MNSNKTFRNWLTLVFVFAGLLQLSAQTIRTADGNQYPATENWIFACDQYAFSGKLEVQIGKTDKGGMLQLAVAVSDPTFFIGDNVYLFLLDGSVITCTDKGNRATNDKFAIAYYFLTFNEIEILKSNPIVNVRFRIKGNEKTFSSRTGHFTATNQLRSINIDNDKKVVFDTPIALTNLFK